MVGSGGPRRDTSASADHTGAAQSGGAVVVSDSGSSVDHGVGSHDEGSGHSGSGSLSDESIEIAAARGGAALDTINSAGGLVGGRADRRRSSDSDGNASRGARDTRTVSVSLCLTSRKPRTYSELEALTVPAVP